jgi:hypothetical protein
MWLVRRWVRPYERGRDDLYALRYTVVGGMSVTGLLPLCGVPAGNPSAPAIVLFVLIWEILLWRATLVGVYVSDRGIKIRTVLRTRHPLVERDTCLGRPSRQPRRLADLDLNS